MSTARPPRIPILEARARRRRELIDRASRFAHAIKNRMPGSLVAAVVVGSVARGDWNKWSDVDLLVVAEPAPDPAVALELAVDPAHPGVQAVIWSPGELAARWARGDPIAREAYTVGIVVAGRLPQR
jgi:predicted nucleotidyltransferase